MLLASLLGSFDEVQNRGDLILRGLKYLRSLLLRIVPVYELMNLKALEPAVEDSGAGKPFGNDSAVSKAKMVSQFPAVAVQTIVLIDHMRHPVKAQRTETVEIRSAL
jgi:hypothetical protein